jgi:hypothetical protein
MTNLNVDLVNDAASVVLVDEEKGTHVHVMVKIETEGDQPATHLRALAYDAAREALRDAQTALE